MRLNDNGFRYVYHVVSAFELNDELRSIIQDCPGSKKASHAVFYGYIDHESELMLELLGAGTLGARGFVFYEPYAGERVVVRANSVKDEDFIFFPNLEMKVSDAYAPRISDLDQFTAENGLEQTREFSFLDRFRDVQYPDRVSVLLCDENNQSEDVWVQILRLEKDCFVGKIVEQPSLHFDVDKDDIIRFGLVHDTNGISKCVEVSLAGMGENLEKYVLTTLKEKIHAYSQHKSNEAYNALINDIVQTEFIVPFSPEFSEKATRILDRYSGDINAVPDEEISEVRSGLKYLPVTLEVDGRVVFPLFTSESEVTNELQEYPCTGLKLSECLDSKVFFDSSPEFDVISINIASDNLCIPREELDESSDLIVERMKNRQQAVILDDLFTERSSVRVTVGISSIFSYALYHNDVKPVRNISLMNITDEPLEDAVLVIRNDIDLFDVYEFQLPTLMPGEDISVSDPQLVVNSKVLAEINEAIHINLRVEVRQYGSIIGSSISKMKVLPYDQWQGSLAYAEYLPAYVLPGHPFIPALMKEASSWLKKWGKDASLDGYQAKKPDRIRELAAAAYAAIQKKNIGYAEPPARVSMVGQRIRTPDVMIQQRLGTCMDMTLLYAALLEAMGLHPILVLITGHIFAGVWLKERSKETVLKSDIILKDIGQLTMRFGHGADEMTFVECTAMCEGHIRSFEDAELDAKMTKLSSVSDFVMAIDVYAARLKNIRSLPSRVSDGGIVTIEQVDRRDSEITEAPKALGITNVEVPVHSARKISTKKELWESKLLDISTRNILLSLPSSGAKALAVMSSHIDELEDAISDGHEFNLFSVPDWLMTIVRQSETENSKPETWLSVALKEFNEYEITKWPAVEALDVEEKIRQDYHNHRMYTFLSASDLEKALTKIYRTAKASQQENGVSSMYLAVGMLKWYDEDKKKEAHYAPLILVPIEIVRKPLKQGYALHMRDEEARFNSTLLEMLKQKYNVEIGGVDPLPGDEHGTDIKRVFKIVRSALYTIPNWDVIETCAIGNFSFSQFAMWSDIHTSGDTFEKSKLVRSLVKGYVDWDRSEEKENQSSALYLPISVDDSQIQAIRLAASDSTFVLHGPPGTGKSQTITAMIANLMANGKRVLFVAEKMAALTVVQKRLASLGLDDFCLELHSDKATKKQVLEQLGRAISYFPVGDGNQYDYLSQKTTEKRRSLDSYVEHLHKKQKCGYSLSEIVAKYELVRNEPQYIKFDPDEVANVSRNFIDQHEVLISMLMRTGSVIGEKDRELLADIHLRDFSSDIRSSLKTSVREYRDDMMNLKSASDSLSDVFGELDKSSGTTIEKIKSYGYYCSMVLNGKPIDDLTMALLTVKRDEIMPYYNERSVMIERRNNMLQNYNSEFLKEDMDVYRTNLIAAHKKVIRRNAAMQAIISTIQPKVQYPIDTQNVWQVFDGVQKYQEQYKQFTDHVKNAPDGLKTILHNFVSEHEYDKACIEANKVKQTYETFPGGMTAYIALSSDEAAKEKMTTYMGKLNKYTEMELALNRLLCRESERVQQNSIEKECELLEFVLDNPASLKNWSLYYQAKSDCLKAGLEPVVDEYENSTGIKNLVGSYKNGFYKALINSVIFDDDVLSRFAGPSFNESIEQFKELDNEYLLQTRKEIVRLLSARVPRENCSAEVGKEMNLLRKAISSNARGMSIRELFGKISHVLPDLCPCMLMSPNSVSQYLEHDNEMFDVVIFDEASQLPTCKAIGALLRARNAVVVGDPKQMPPTTFFASAGPEVDDLSIDDLDSILEDVLALGVNSQYLKWHYRSQHESLIAFSNSHFYDNKMHTFPSANANESHVNFVYVQGVYTKRTNEPEAKAIVDEIKRRFRDENLRKQSVGVVTFNITQQTLIEDMLEKEYQKNSSLDRWANSGETPLFVKNLENVQGDERDVILFSVCYGPDEKGHISMNFGPVNKQGGNKRLNVAFTRARNSMMLFSSLHASDLKVTNTSPEGVIALRDFLKFAENKGAFSDVAGRSDEILEKNGVIRSICDAIEEHGYTCVPEIGYSDFHVDIGVVNPHNPSSYLMGILLDGDSYHLTENTRDREVAQIEILKGLGWNLHRVWTIDWVDGRENEIRKIIDELDILKEKASLEQPVEQKPEVEDEQVFIEKDGFESDDSSQETPEDNSAAERPEINSSMPYDPRKTVNVAEYGMDTEVIAEEKVASAVSYNASNCVVDSVEQPFDYVMSELPYTPMSQAEFCSNVKRDEIVERITLVLNAEAPIRKEILLRRVLASYNINRTESSFAVFEKAYRAAKVTTTKQNGTVFCWNSMQDPDHYKSIRISSDRHVDEICFQEIRNAACYVLKRRGPIDKVSLIKEISLVFGYRRLGKQLEEGISNALTWSRRTKMIESDRNEYYRINPEYQA